MTGVEPYVLRYWESEFNFKLSKSKNKQRLYQKRDIETVQKIKKLLYDERYTIEGAKKKLKERKKRTAGSLPGENQLSFDLKNPKTHEKLLKIKEEIESLLKRLNQP